MSSLPLPLWPESERPREKLLKLGAPALSEAELLAILLQTGTRGRTAVDTARMLLGEFRSVRGLLTAERDAVCRTPGLGAAKYALLQAALELSRRHYAEQMSAGPPLANPRATREFLRARLRDREHEVFCCLFLDNRHRFIALEEILRGTHDAASVHPLTSALRDLPGLRFMRDPTRGGLATVAHEICRARNLGLRLDETAIPINDPVRSVCEILGYDPLYLACEGRVVAVLAPADA
jgi:hypothetical protein